LIGEAQLLDSESGERRREADGLNGFNFTQQSIRTIAVYNVS
jgi:hypothetical protein